MRRIEWEQPEACEQCGGEAFRPSTRGEQLGRWFTHGTGAAAAWYCRSCNASWSGGSGSHALYHTSGSGWWRRARLPLDLLAAVRHARNWHPVPLFYAAVGGAALVAAAAVAAFTRTRWWVAVAGVPVAAMAGAFLLSLASAAGRGRRDVLWRLAPERAWRADLEEELIGLRAQIHSFDLLVPEGWAGTVSLDGASWLILPRGSRVLRDVRVIADQGDPQLDPDSHTPGWRPSTPRVELHITNDTWPTPEDQALCEFVERAFPLSPPDLGPATRQEMQRRLLAVHRDHERHRQRWEAELADTWRDGHVRVDGVAIPARLLTHDDTDVGVATFLREDRAVMLIVEGVDLDTLTLPRVTDPHPLVDEFERRRRRIFTRSSL